MNLKFTLEALNDLKRLRAFIAEKNPAAADRMSQRLKQQIYLLLENPNIGITLDELGNVQQWVADDYIVRYSVEDNTLLILKIWHHREDR